MKFARVVFAIAGIWGVLIVTPLYFTRDLIGRQYPPPITHPDFYYGFVSVTLVWQLAFLLIATDPVRFRPIMVAAMLEKFVYIAAMTTLRAGTTAPGAVRNRGPRFCARPAVSLPRFSRLGSTPSQGRGPAGASSALTAVPCRA